MRKVGLAVLAGMGLSLAVGGIGVAADMPVKMPAKVAAPNSWSGWYVGLNAGYLEPASSLVSTDATIISPGTGTDPVEVAGVASGARSRIGKGNGGFIGGAQLGWNYLASPSLLIGIETDIQWSSLRESGSVTTIVPTNIPGQFWRTQITASRSLDYLGTLRGRLGGIVTPSVLIYGTGGLAYGGANSSTSIFQAGFDPGGFPPAPSAIAGSSSGLRAGYTVGAGLEWMFARNWNAKLEYLYYDLGSVTYANGVLAQNVGPTNFSGGGIITAASNSNTRFDGHVFRVGVNYMLGR
ncbi:outer membrane beta-barrel protein [Bradyrhizobium sp.]|uniref:outer membrane protein n=1 Tax=Bradyrhizobium sp. TaxID=376 RepID=UPI001DC6A059|nr:outer membrane beta-barrel protein [Bradyrhizobium sp.]MBI5322268.1 porin family protein [Bradyrhizobium sp.]